MPINVDIKILDNWKIVHLYLYVIPIIYCTGNYFGNKIDFKVYKTPEQNVQYAKDIDEHIMVFIINLYLDHFKVVAELYIMG